MTCSVYSPGAPKVAVVVAFPAKVAFGGIFPPIFSTTGLGSENVTAPGPRNRVQVMDTGTLGVRVPGETTLSSAVQTVSVSGSPAGVSFDAVSPRGPCTIGPL